MPHELTIPVVGKQDSKRIVMGPVLVPDEPDSDGDIVSAEKIEDVAVEFMLEYSNIDVMHSLNNVGKVVFNDILRQPEVHKVGEEEIELPAGTWIMGVKVTDEDTWSEVENGTFKGFSIMAIPSAIFKSLKDSGAEAKKFVEASKRMTLEDLGKEWIVNAVSVVDDPAVPKAKFFAIKNRDKSKDKNPGKSTEKGRFEIPDSFGFIKRRVWEALSDRFGDVDIDYLFSDRVIFTTIMDMKSWQMNYTYSDQVVTLDEGSMSQVEIQGSIVPKRSKAEWDALIQSFKNRAAEDSFDSTTLFPHSVKEKLSATEFDTSAEDIFKAFYDKSNHDAIKSINPDILEGCVAFIYNEATGKYPSEKQSWFDVIKGIFNSPKTSSEKTNILEELDMDEAKLKELIQSTVKETVESTVESTVGEIVEKKVDERLDNFLESDKFKESVKSFTQPEDDEGEGDDPSAQKGDEGGDNPEDTPSAEKNKDKEDNTDVEKRLKSIEETLIKLGKGKSNAARGQDSLPGYSGDEEKDVFKTMTGRDAYGRRVKTYEELSKQDA